MTEAQCLEQQLQAILSQLRQDRFGGRHAPEVTLADGTSVGADGTLSGTIEVHIRKRDGELALLHTQSLDGISDGKTLKNTFAMALSKVLANHANWPR